MDQSNVDQIIVEAHNYQANNEFQQSIYSFEKALEFLEENNKNEENDVKILEKLANIYYEIATNYEKLENFEKAKVFYNKMVNTEEKYLFNTVEIANTYIIFADCLEKMLEYEESLLFWEKSEKIYLEQNTGIDLEPVQNKIEQLKEIIEFKKLEKDSKCKPCSKCVLI